MNAPAEDRLEATLRACRASLLGFLASRAGGDLEAAEDALSEAVLAALRQWPSQGIPNNPEAWLLTIARRRLLDDQRRQAVRQRFGDEIQYALEGSEQSVEATDSLPDERLKLLFVCAHPAIDEASRTPLMLQVVLGLDAQTIASAFLVAPAAMAQRLVRAKTKIKASRIPFEVPDVSAWPERWAFVLDAVYAAFTQGFQSSTVDSSGQELAQEAVRLGELLVDVLPEEPEALGLLALMLHSYARRRARIDTAGRYVPLDQQDPSAWDREMTDRAESLLVRAAGKNQPGRYQVEAAIQSAHAARRSSGVVEWRVIVALYTVLLGFTPALGARIAHAVARSKIFGPDDGLAALNHMDEARVMNHEPFWAAKAHLLADAGHLPESHAAFDRAIGLCTDPAVRAYLWEKKSQLG